MGIDLEGPQHQATHRFEKNLDRQRRSAIGAMRNTNKWDPLVSVVIPTFNRAKLLSRAIESVRNQTYSNLEIVVVDDASKDLTKEIVAGICDSRIRYVRHETNKGGAVSRNSGIRAATGDYIAFLDDDDEWEPTKTEEQLQALKMFDAVLCTSNEHGDRVTKYGVKHLVDLDDLRRGRFTAGGTGVLMARAEILKETMFDESLPRCQDWDIFIRIAQRYQLGYINKPLVRYNEGIHDRISNAILNMPAVELEQRLIMLDKHREFFGPGWYRKHFAGFLLYGIKHRSDKLRHVMYTVRRCGVRAVAYALAQRVYQKLTGSV